MAKETEDVEVRNRKKKSDINVWDNTVPVEKSSYLRDEDIIFYNIDNFILDTNKLTMLDLFCGAGGFAVGCDWAGFQSVFGVDHFEPAIKTWSRNHPTSIGCLGDIKKVKPRQIRNLLREHGVTHINLITGGVPCQGFSINNRKHNDEDERNFLFLEFMRFVREFKPEYIILENVSGMQSTAGGRFVNNIQEYMRDLGYEPTVQLILAADYGVPQMRQRLLFIGVKRNVGLTIPYVFPQGTFAGNYRTVEEAISDLPPLENNQTVTNYQLAPQNDYQRLMRGVGNITAIMPPTYLANHKSPNHPQDTINKIAATLPGQPMYENYKQRIRLSLNEPSPTQCAGGIRPQFQFGHPTQPRGLTIRERARIQSFPDWYIFEGGIVQERVQTGNAVPPLMIYNVALPIAADINRRNAIRNQRRGGN